MKDLENLKTIDPMILIEWTRMKPVVLRISNDLREIGLYASLKENPVGVIEYRNLVADILRELANEEYGLYDYGYLKKKHSWKIKKHISKYVDDKVHINIIQEIVFEDITYLTDNVIEGNYDKNLMFEKYLSNTIASIGWYDVTKLLQTEAGNELICNIKYFKQILNIEENKNKSME